MRYARREYREKGAPVRDRRVEYSDDHHFLLVYCAERANEILQARHGFTVPPQELMADGWYYGLRRLKAGELAKATTNVIRLMTRCGKSRRLPMSHIPLVEEDYDTDASPSAVVDPFDPFQQAEAADELVALLAGMDETLLAIGVAYYGHGLTFREIGKRYGRTGERMRQLANRFLEQARARVVAREARR